MDAKEALTDEQVLEIWHNAPHEDRWNLLKEITEDLKRVMRTYAENKGA